MTKQEFKARWESDDDGGITMNEVAECAKAWGVCAKPKINPMQQVLYKVLVAAGVDAEPYKPEDGDA